MRTILIAALMLLGTGAADAQSLNCTRAFTGMEQSICGNPSLLEKYDQMNQLTGQAVADNKISTAAAEEYRNGLARLCRTSEDLDQCLAHEITRAISVLNDPALDSDVVKPEPNEAFSRLQTQLDQAEQHFRSTGDAKLSVAALLALIQYHETSPQSDTTATEVRALKAQLLGGCHNLELRREWNQELQTYGWSCPLNYASNELD